ncbi:MAG: tRNA (N(6)-L-threonylcarbamoyladenosine(37)-C(2))-methylthiotransferase [Candidatus Bathyarchaeota archaeon]|nr:MAG: tRNA (N(6)-L-threonylcarbamoyladenosine(37)-C(2))-methylthiotransferase [Candidatus Bathyarchaeota archaeon]
MGRQELIARAGKRVYVRSFGCPTNIADGECIIGCLSQVGYEIVENVEAADILIYNTCAVKSPTENRMIEVLRRVSEDKQLIVTGCLPLINFERLRNQVRFDGVLGPAPGSEIIKAVDKVGRGEKVVTVKRDSKPGLDLPRTHLNETVGIVPINYGCLGSCSYCCVLFARGNLRSQTTDAIVKRVQRDLASGVNEIWLTSQDTASYGKDLETNLVDLLNEVCTIKENFFIRVGMMTPNYALELLDGLIDAYRNKSIFKFLHLPVQSGDDGILRLMNRFYSTKDFTKVVCAFRRKIPRMTVATDIICGFPGESPDAFERTVQLVEFVQPDIVNISKFFPRPHTPATKMEQLPPKEVKARSKRMAELVRKISFEKNKAWMDWEGKILIDEKGKNPGSWIGRNFAYKPIVVNDNRLLLGKFVDVRVIGIFPTYLKAEVI